MLPHILKILYRSVKQMGNAIYKTSISKAHWASDFDVPTYFDCFYPSQPKTTEEEGIIVILT